MRGRGLLHRLLATRLRLARPGRPVPSATATATGLRRPVPAVGVGGLDSPKGRRQDALGPPPGGARPTQAGLEDVDAGQPDAIVRGLARGPLGPFVLLAPRPRPVTMVDEVEAARPCPERPALDMGRLSRPLEESGLLGRRVSPSVAVGRPRRVGIASARVGTVLGETRRPAAAVTKGRTETYTLGRDAALLQEVGRPGRDKMATVPMDGPGGGPDAVAQGQGPTF